MVSQNMLLRLPRVLHHLPQSTFVLNDLSD